MARAIHPLRQRVYRGNIALDAPWFRIAAAAEVAILRRAVVGPDGVPRLTALGAALALGDVERLLAGSRRARTGVIVGTQADAERLGERT